MTTRASPHQIVQSSIELSRSFFGTGSYWKNLYKDYKNVAIETVQEAKDKPRKTLLILSGTFIYESVLDCFWKEHNWTAGSDLSPSTYDDSQPC